VVIAAVQDPAVGYPTSEDYFSPDRVWPEYRLGHVSGRPNPAYSLVRKCLADAGLDSVNFGKAAWNPLGAYISPGDRVFLMCNFVEQKIGAISDEMLFAKCTHGSVIRAMIDYVLIALQGKGSIGFGNAPLQSCDWNAVIDQTGALQVQKFFTDIHKGSVGVKLSDLRRHVIRRRSWGGVAVDLHDNTEDHTVEVDLGEKSLLEMLYRGQDEPKFRVLDYDPRRTAFCHGMGKHLYLVHREIMESDAIISIPKLKTHEKVGMTCAIKGCVGAVSHKDCLAHHRYGPSSLGGDEYPDSLSFLRGISAVHDAVYKMEPGFAREILHAVDVFSRKLTRRFHRALSGSWPGNDTCWRMAVDLATILEYADRKGDLHKDKQRKHMMLADGIIGGEGDGPLSPRPVSLGYLCFSDNVTAGDYVNALAMGFRPDTLPIIREALKPNDYPLFRGEPSELVIRWNGETLRAGSFHPDHGRKFLPPKEWRGTL
jgi:uncharacterized protein (DUF362 family)